MIYYRSLNSYLRERFGEKLYKIALDGGFTCPNRDGTKGDRGCIFCLDGSSAFSVPCTDNVDLSVENAKMLVSGKGARRYIAYFQSYSGTYASADIIEKLYKNVAERDDIAAISIGTRPDCLGDDIMRVLEEINEIKPLFIELGLQTIHEKTADYIRRGYPLAVYDEAVDKLTRAGIETVAHMIIGLPGEDKKMMAETASYIADSGAKGIKYQLLHVLKGTDLEKEYSEGKVKVLSLDEYTDILGQCIASAGEEIVVHRLTGDGSKRDLIAPLWSADKKKVLNAIHREIRPLPES